MFSTFTTRGGKTLIIRAEDVRIMLDKDSGAALTLLVGQNEHYFEIEGSAQENMDRLKAEELAAIELLRRSEQRQSVGLPPIPISRGRVK